MTRKTPLRHPMVRDYLRALDAAFASLPVGQAREVREQITAHLDEVLTPDSGDREVADALSRLGTPERLAREAAAGIPPRTLGQRLLSRMARLTWRRWLAIGAAIVVVGGSGGYAAVIEAAPPLQGPGSFAWLFLPAHTRPVESSADGAQQTTVPIRSGQRQGFLVSVTNPGPWTQTILGPGAGFVTPGSESGSVAVSLADPMRPHSALLLRTYSLPVAIPPHQSRMVRVEWVSTACISKGGGLGIDTLRLRVRIGWITRTEAIPLDMDVALSGPSKGPCH